MATGVYSIRLDNNVLKMMDEMGDVNWQAEIRQMIEAEVRQKKKMKLLSRAEERAKHMKVLDISAAEMIREDRDAR